jgi:hypothetical protein
MLTAYVIGETRAKIVLSVTSTACMGYRTRFIGLPFRQD